MSNTNHDIVHYTYTNYSNIHLSMDLIGGFFKNYFNLFNSSNFISVFYNNRSLNILIIILLY